MWVVVARLDAAGDGPATCTAVVGTVTAALRDAEAEGDRRKGSGGLARTRGRGNSRHRGSQGHGHRGALRDPRRRRRKAP